MTRPTIAVLSDQTLFRRGVKLLLERHGFRRIHEYSSRQEALEGARLHPPDILFVDLDHEREDVMTLVRALRHALLDAHIVVMGSPARQGAANGLFDAEVETPKADVPALLAAAALSRERRQSVEAQRQRRLWEKITPRQRDVMRWLAAGSDNQTVARKLRIGVRAVKAHVSTLLETFGVDNRTQLALLADHAGLRPPADRAHA